MPFEKFVPPRRQKPPQVSIKRTGTITFDAGFAGTLGLSKVGHVTLYFDPAKKLVGVRPAPDPKEEGALKLSHRKRVSSVRARSFFETYGITLTVTQKYPVQHDKDAGMAVISMGEIKRRRGPRRKRV